MQLKILNQISYSTDLQLHSFKEVARKLKYFVLNQLLFAEAK